MELIKEIEYDCAVVGGGASGVAAAIGAAQTGVKTLLIERSPYFGGQATHANVPSYCGFFTQSDPPEQAVAGVGQMVLANLASLGFYQGPRKTARTGTHIVTLDAEAVKFAMDKCITASRADYLLHTAVISAEVVDGLVKSITCITDGGRLRIGAKSFVDASGEGNLVAMCGGGFKIGDGNGHMQVGTMMFRIGGVPLDVDINPFTIQEAILKGKDAGITPLGKDLGIIVRIPGKSGDVLGILADEEVDPLDVENLTKCEISGRKQAWAYLETFRRFLPGFENAYLVHSGPQFGVRDSRHIIGEYVLTGEEAISGRRFHDAIARGAWYCESHPEKGKPNISIPIKDLSYFHIPIGCLKVKNKQNLWAAGRIISCDSIAFASVRVMGTGFATGQAAGVAAALQAHKGVVDIEAVQKELIQQGAII